MNTTNPKTDTDAAEQLTANFESDLAATDRARSEALEGLQQLSTAKASHMQRARARLIDRLGAEDPRVLELNGVIASNQLRTRALKLEVDRARAGIVEADDQGWALHGYVWNQGLVGQPNLTVATYDRDGRWVRTLGYACTDTNGYFKLSYRRSSEKLVEETGALNKSAEVFIRVSDQKKNVLTTDKNPVQLEMGQVEYREIFLGSKSASCQPPSDESGGYTVSKARSKNKDPEEDKSS
ncbi:MAG: hypothetical protein QOF24_2938 [Verrucomicrobiota bacterium]|jgi:hypothetical protein